MITSSIYQIVRNPVGPNCLHILINTINSHQTGKFSLVLLAIPIEAAITLIETMQNVFELRDSFCCEHVFAPISRQTFLLAQYICLKVKSLT